jgi:tRNA threonylcarbamoyladenosine biosynthesis protein TsaB
VLVVDTAMGLCGVGVFDVVDGVARPLGVRSEAMTRGHQERLAVLAREALAEAGGFDGIARVGATVGPGSFTGLRVGLAFAQGLGAARGLPVAGVSTLDALAAEAGEGRDVAALVDARRGQVYARFWAAGRPQGPAEALSLEAAASRAAALGPDAILIGSGLGLITDVPSDARLAERAGPDLAAVARLAAAASVDANPPRPLYLRAPDATPPSRLPGQPRPPKP